ncbi:MAG: CPBP family intramembrane metalloprotease [Cytophagales bacterium]|nr:CPBP family intramembrane metalloprotease [Cytophaga sp.]
MKKIYSILSDYVRHELKGKYVLGLLIFLIPAIALNYYFDFENDVLGSYRKEYWYVGACFLYYGIPYWYAILLYIFMYDKKHLFKQKRFICLSIFFPFIIGFDEAFNYHKLWVAGIDDEILRYYLKSTLNHTVTFITYFIPVLLYYFFFEKENKNFYGLAPTKWDLKPYLFMLFAVMMPLIIIASFTASFQESYPIYNMTVYKDQLPGSYWQQVLVFESMYLFDFSYIELLFRGIMVHTMYKYMGAECILAMATVYCTYHFGKPMGETISSFVGGTIVGILSLRTQSLYGGIIIHAGIALMMEAASFGQKINW